MFFYLFNGDLKSMRSKISLAGSVGNKVFNLRYTDIFDCYDQVTMSVYPFFLLKKNYLRSEYLQQNSSPNFITVIQIRGVKLY